MRLKYELFWQFSANKITPINNWEIRNTNFKPITTNPLSVRTLIKHNPEFWQENRWLFLQSENQGSV